MKKILLAIFLFFTFSYGSEYSDGYKFFKQGKKELNNGNKSKANILFLKAKEKFEVAVKHNSTQAMLKLATLYCNGWGVNEDKNKAKQYLNGAEKLGASFVSDKCLKTLKGESK
jgi:TPR repeat protein